MTLNLGIKTTNKVLDLALTAIEYDLWKKLDMTEEEADNLFDILSGGEYDEPQWFIINGISTKEWDEVTKETEGIARIFE